MTVGNKIAELRKAKGMTQEALANELGVSNQAVSKWEANQSCPDIQLLPQIADIFEITLDCLFGRETVQAYPVLACENHMTGESVMIEAKEQIELPWEDDGKLRAVVYIGHKLALTQDCTEASEITFVYEGAALDIISSFSVSCDDVAGSVTADGSVTCDSVEGDVHAKGSVNCDSVEGNVTANGSINCDGINGNASAGGNITCDEINGNASAGGNIICDNLSGELSAGGSIICDDSENTDTKKCEIKLETLEDIDFDSPGEINLNGVKIKWSKLKNSSNTSECG